MLNNRTKSQSHNETWSDFVMKSMFKYYLNMTLFFWSSIFRHSAAPQRQDSRRRRHSPMRTARRPRTRYVTCSMRTSSSLSLWPPTAPSLDLNPVDYAVGCPAADGLPMSKFRLSRQTQTSSNVVKAWKKLSQSFLDKSIGEWHRRLDAVIRLQSRGLESLTAGLQSLRLASRLKPWLRS